MSVLLFVLVPMLAVTAYALYTWARNRQPSSVEAGVDAFRREMSALSPDAAPIQRRVDPRTEQRVDPETAPPPVSRPEARPGTERRPPRRPGGADPDRRP